MAVKTIDYVDRSWNFAPGCNKVSQGCANCYAIRQANRLAHMPHSKESYRGLIEKTFGKLNWSGNVNILVDRIIQPYNWSKSSRIFVNSMGDTFHEKIPFDILDMAFAVMGLCHNNINEKNREYCNHECLIVTKRAKRMYEYFSGDWKARLFYALEDMGFGGEAQDVLGQNLESSGGGFLPNVWLGITGENQDRLNERWYHLSRIPAAVRFVSIEPMLGEIEIKQATHYKISERQRLNNISYVDAAKEPDWIVLGGESGPGARPMYPGWVRAVMDECIDRKIPFYFKQWGAWKPIDMAGLPGGKGLEIIKNLGFVNHSGMLRVGNDPVEYEGLLEKCWYPVQNSRGKDNWFDGKQWFQYPGMARI